MSSTKALRILMVEDVPADAELIEDELRSSGMDFVCARVYERERLVEALETFSPEVIVSDYRLPGFSGAEALSIAREFAPDLPFVFVTGALGEDRAVELMKKGATDFVLKDRLSRLPLCVMRALQEAEERRQRKEAETELEKHRHHLEELVKERTGQLEAANARLQAEIIERKRAEEAMRRAKEEWERTFASVPDLIAIMDDRHRVVRVNPAMARKLGRTPEECVGLACHVVVHGTSSPPPFCPHTRTLSECRQHMEEVHEERLGGHFLISTTPICDEEGKMLGSVHVARDITERKRAEEALAKAHDDLEKRVAERTAELRETNEALRIRTTMLEQSNRDLDEFAHVASHDLQEPLRKIQTFADRLVTAYRDSLDDKGRDYLERMKRSAARMQLLVRELLGYSRIAARPAHATRFNLRDLIEEAVAELGVFCKEKEGRIQVGELPHIEADRAQMRQLFQNLIGNGLKFRGEHRPVIRVASRSSSSDPFWEIHVEDNGIGFDECYLDKIFQPFQRLHGKDPAYPGTGMGLAVCRRIVERHGGSITARSQPGRGATFIVKLPIKAQG